MCCMLSQLVLCPFFLGSKDEIRKKELEFVSGLENLSQASPDSELNPEDPQATPDKPANKENTEVRKRKSKSANPPAKKRKAQVPTEAILVVTKPPTLDTMNNAPSTTTTLSPPTPALSPAQQLSPQPPSFSHFDLPPVDVNWYDGDEWMQGTGVCI